MPSAARSFHCNDRARFSEDHQREPMMTCVPSKTFAAVVAGTVIAVCTGLVRAQQPVVDTSRIGPAVGSAAPSFSGTDQFGRTQTLQSGMGAKGVMLVFFRSADW